MSTIYIVLPESEISVNEFPLIGCKSSTGTSLPFEPKSRDIIIIIYIIILLYLLLIQYNNLLARPQGFF